MSYIGSMLLKRAYTAGNTFVHRLDGRTKFIFFFWISIIAYIFYDYIIISIMLISLLILARIAKIHKQVYLTEAVILIPWMIVGIIILAPPFGFGGNKTVLFTLHIFGREIPFYYEGMAWAITWPMRIGVCIGSAMLFYLTTPLAVITTTIMKMKLPYRLAYMFTAAVQLIPILADEIGTIYQAQVSRGLRTDVSVIKKLKNFVALVVPLTLSSLNRVQIRAITLESRGFTAPVEKTPLREICFKKEDYILFLIMALFTLIATYILLTYGYSPIVHLKYVVAG